MTCNRYSRVSKVDQGEKAGGPSYAERRALGGRTELSKLGVPQLWLVCRMLMV